MDSDIEEKIHYSPEQQDINLTDDLCSEKSSKSKIYSKEVYIYSWGKNKYGELGLNNAKNAYTPAPIKTLKSTIIKSVKSGGRNTILLTKDDKVLMCGSNIFNLLAINTKFQNNEQYQKTFKLLKYFDENNEKIKEIAIAEFHSLALNNNGEIFGWGGNLYNKLGQTNGLCGLPSKIIIKRKIVSIACGDYHSCALSENGVLYTWGGGGESYNKGQCGHGSKKDVEYPKKVEYFTKKSLHIIKISCGGYHTIAMDENNQLYGFGKGIFGQCGYGHTEDAISPKKIIFSENNIIIDVKCGGEHTMFLSNEGKVYVCGHGYFGQLGLGNNKNIKYPILVQSLSNKNVIEIDAGWSHSIVLTDERNVYVTGCGKFGELGLGENKNRYNYTWLRKLGPMNVKHIFAGGHHSWCIIDDKYPLKERFIEPEPLEKPNFIMTKRKLSDLSDKNDLSFNEKNNRRNRCSNTVDYKNRRFFDNDNEDNYLDNNHNRINSFDNNEILHNQELKKMIDDYNDEKINSSNNIDNLIDHFENINNSDVKNNKNNRNKNNENFNNNDNEDNYIRNNDYNQKDDDNNNLRIDTFKNNNNKLSKNSFANKENNKSDYNNINVDNEDNYNNFLKDNTNDYINNNDNKNNYKDDYDSNDNPRNEDDYMSNNKDYENKNEEDDILNDIHNNNKNKNFLNNKENNQLNNSKENINKKNNKHLDEKNINNEFNKKNKISLNNNENDENIYTNKDNENKNNKTINKINKNYYGQYNNKANKNVNSLEDKYNSGSSHGENKNANIILNNRNYQNEQNKNIPNNNNFYNNKNKGINSNIFSQKNNEALSYLRNINKNKIQLQVIYSQLNLSHRFVRFGINSTNKYFKLEFNTMNNMISKYLSFDKGNISFKLQNDREIVKEGKKAINPMMDDLLKEMKDSGLFNTESKNIINYTLAIVYDYNKNSMLRKIYEEFRDNYEEKNISYINFKIVNENEIKNGQNEVEGMLSKWTLDFYEQFKELFIYYEDEDVINLNVNNYGEKNVKVLKPRFLEMRPKIFK